MNSGEAGWGGARKGAGRKPKLTLTAHIAVPRALWAAIEAEAARKGTSPEQEAARILTEHFKVPSAR